MPASKAPVSTTLRLTRTFAAPREKVFRAWIEPQALKTWFAPSDSFETPVAEVEPRAGGAYRIAMRSPDGETYTVIGTYREINPPEKLVFSWAWEGWPEAQETLVTVEFHERSGQTELVLTHERFPDEAVRDKHSEGWNGCLDRLVKAL